MNRRGFLAGILSLGVAPAIVRADSLMKIVPRNVELLLPYSEDITINQMRDLDFYDGIQWSQRDLAHQRLAKWYEDQLDRIAFNTITGVKT